MIEHFEDILTPFNFETAQQGICYYALLRDATDRWFRGQVLHFTNSTGWYYTYAGNGVKLVEHTYEELWERINAESAVFDIANSWFALPLDGALKVYEWLPPPPPFTPLPEDMYF